MIPYASDNDSGSVDLQLSNLEDIKKDPSSLEVTGEKGKGLKKWGEGAGKANLLSSEVAR